MQSTEVISVNLWQMLISLLNLLILFLILKKFMYKPVKKTLAERQKLIDERFENAQKAQSDADSAKSEYESKLANADSEAADIIKAARAKAERKSEKIVSSAKSKADDILRQAQTDAELEKKKAEADIKNEITEVSSLLTEKLLGREINAADHRDFINSFIEKIGEEND
ncbi:MAG: F0F1 ATP synthase subunit B [Clostridia bacterium]|nr:F0F1 ATP synthase subunit B [Clostridia bacterium]MBQ2153276.1 F0F1 ATP synthase subunit B [Clostridia bacterium]MBQ2347103.1 F0F1 ATP synthase subunit B [Clostridia bacterium]MBQ5440335.1 F0F1 ATP synthase subunit B [Clostridia bacterium]